MGAFACFSVPRVTWDNERDHLEMCDISLLETFFHPEPIRVEGTTDGPPCEWAEQAWGLCQNAARLRFICLQYVFSGVTHASPSGSPVTKKTVVARFVVRPKKDPRVEYVAKAGATEAWQTCPSCGCVKGPEGQVWCFLVSGLGGGQCDVCYSCTVMSLGNQ